MIHLILFITCAYVNSGYYILCPNIYAESETNPCQSNHKNGMKQLMKMKTDGVNNLEFGVPNLHLYSEQIYKA